MPQCRFNKVAVVAGGFSGERNVSLTTGRGVTEALKRKGVNATLIDAGHTLHRKLDRLKPQAVYNALHGPWGEDGTVQGLLEWMGIPYTGSGVRQSAVCMDKLTTKALMAALDVPMSPHVVDNGKLTYAQIKRKLGPRFVCKPSAEGSSLGVVIIHSEKDFKGVAKVRRNFSRLFFERFEDGAQITVAIIDYPSPKVLPILELRPKNPFYDYEAKYTKGMTDFLLPAPIGRAATTKAKALALRLHQEMGLRTFSRTDMIVTQDGVVVLEVNTHPGMTPTSDLPAQAAQAGIPYDDLVILLMNTAVLHK